MPLNRSDFAVALVCLGRSRQAEATVLAQLRDDPALQVQVVADADGLQPQFDLVLWVADPAALRDLCSALSAAQLARPARPQLVLGLGLPAAGIERLMAHGAADFVALHEAADELLPRVHRALGLVAVAPPPAAGADAANPADSALVGASAAFRRAVARLPRYASCDAGVLLLGETGTGKEVCAQAIHYQSSRAAGPWVAVNCAAIPAELVEDELFGHVRGAYTHAHAARPGLVAEAEHGTLFLDEIDSLPLAAQAKLLRFLQDKQYRAVGSSTCRQADVRVIAASNRALEPLVAAGSFRQDLLFRLNMLTLTLPPLRERRDDVPALAQHFFAAACRDSGRALTGLTPSALRRLVAYDWPGNVRELKHTVERAVLLAAGPAVQGEDIEIDGLAAAPDEPSAPGPVAERSFQAAKALAVQQFERSFIEGILQASAGNIAHAARLAHKNRRAFFELLRKHDIDAGRFRH